MQFLTVVVSQVEINSHLNNVYVQNVHGIFMFLCIYVVFPGYVLHILSCLYYTIFLEKTTAVSTFIPAFVRTR
jgi:hypothetical protein